MTMNPDYLIKMIHQITANFSYAEDQDKIADLTAGHIQKFWDPRMKKSLADYVKQSEGDIAPLVLLVANKI